MSYQRCIHVVFLDYPIPPPDLSGKVGKLFKSQKWGTEKKNEKGKEKRKRGRKKGGGEKMRKKEKIKAVKRWGRISRCWEVGWGKRKVIKSRRISDDAEITGGENRLSKSRRGSLDDNRGGEDILINPRRKNPQVSAS